MPYIRDVSNLVATGLCLGFLAVLVTVHMKREWTSQERTKSRTSTLNVHGNKVGNASPSPTGTSGKLTPTFDRSVFHLPRRSISSMAVLKFPNELERKRKMAELMTWVSILSSIGMLFGTLWLRLAYFRVIPIPPHCQTATEALTALYIITRCSLYAVYINRVNMAFHNTIYAYSDRVISLCYVVVGVVFVLLIIWAPFAVKSHPKRGRYGPNGKHINSDSGDDSDSDSQRRGMKICVVKPNVLISLFIVVFDVVFIAVMVRMFVVPLRKLFKHTDGDREIGGAANTSHHHRSMSSISVSADGGNVQTIPEEEDIDPSRRKVIRLSKSQLFEMELKLLPVKYSVISVVSVLTTCLALVVVAGSSNGLAITVSNVIDVVLLLLMTSHWTPEYWRLCGPLLRSLHSLRMVGNATHEHLVRMTGYYAQSSQLRGVIHRSYSSGCATPPPSMQTEVDFI